MHVHPHTTCAKWKKKQQTTKPLGVVAHDCNSGGVGTIGPRFNASPGYRVVLHLERGGQGERKKGRRREGKGGRNRKGLVKEVS